MSVYKAPKTGGSIKNFFAQEYIEYGEPYLAGEKLTHDLFTGAHLVLSDRTIHGITHHFVEIPLIISSVQRRGSFKNFMEILERELPADFCGIYIEGVHSAILDQWCIRHGWKCDPNDRISYYKLYHCEGNH